MGSAGRNCPACGRWAPSFADACVECSLVLESVDDDNAYIRAIFDEFSVRANDIDDANRVYAATVACRDPAEKAGLAKDILRDLSRRMVGFSIDLIRCACGAPITKPRKGRMPLRCVLCFTERQRKKTVESKRRRGCKVETKGRYLESVRRTEEIGHRLLEGRRKRMVNLRAVRRAAGLCQLCGKAPATSRCETCKAKRKEARKR